MPITMLRIFSKGKCKKDNTTHQYSLVADTTYALLLYLMYATEEMLSHTTYYVGKNLNSCNLEHKVFLPPITSYTDKGLMQYRFRCLWKYRKALAQSEIYAQDHLYFSAPLIDNLPYILLEDCPRFFTVLDGHHITEYKGSRREKLYNLLVGRIYCRYGGDNPYCKKRLVTTTLDKKFFDDRNISAELCDLKVLWNNSSEEKQKYIKNVFGLSYMESFEGRDVVIFSQPLAEDCHFSKAEITALFQPYIDKYGAERILFKMHPRDRFDYQQVFPGVGIMRTKAPQQLLSAMGIKFRTAITVCSSAVSSMEPDTEIIWIGTDIDPRIVKAYGHIDSPV